MRNLWLFFISISLIPAHGQELDSVTLYLKWDHQFEFAGYYAAQDQGYFEEQGLHVTMKIVRNSWTQIGYTESKTGRYGIVNSDVLKYRLEGKKIVMVMPIFQHSSVVFFTHAADTILHPQDLKGKRLIIPQILFPELRLMMDREGIDPSSAEIDSVWNLDKFLAREAEAIVQLSLDVPFMPEPDSIRVIYPLQYGVDFYGEILYTSELEMLQHPDRAERMKEAVQQGWQYAMTHPEEIISYIQTEYDSALTYEDLYWEFGEIQKLMAFDLVEIGQNNRGRWENMYRDLVTVGLLSPGLKLDGFFFDDYFSTNEDRLNTILTIIAILLGIVFVFLIISWIINKRLNALLDERLLELNMRNDELTKMNNELDNFVYRVSHDLRSPISSSIGLLNLMEKESDDHLLEYQRLMRKSLKKLDTFILDILNYSRNSRLEIETEEVNVEELITDVNFARKFLYNLLHNIQTQA